MEIIGYSLLEFPDDSIHLEIEVQITNNDHRTVNIDEIAYQISIEGIMAKPEKVKISQEFSPETPLILDLPLSVATHDALSLFSQIESGEELAYQVTGTIHFDDPILKLFDIPLNVTGSASVDIGYEDFYTEPEVEISDIEVDFTLINLTTYQFDFTVTLSVVNENPYAITVDEMNYTVDIEGIVSDPGRYTDLNSSPFYIEADQSGSLQIPIVFTLALADGLALINALSDVIFAYEVVGDLHVIDVSGFPVDITIPYTKSGEFEIIGME